ncbi:transposase [Aquimarina sp. ERC-38]|uniref:transposase n=1 Tax=Aquimarina sp. ERC-38 TaxID=2949996 RepID=UPI0022470B73|nr:transposase [Aquimarina sp. ERC-38]UZO79149.1 transposase [Aquimarina sp. ERC-38]
MKKRSYDLDFKRTIVELVVSGKRVSEVCKEYDLGTGMVNRWRREFTKNSTDIKSTQEVS